MGNLLMLNLGYDIEGETTFVIHLLLMGPVILLPQAARFADFFLFNRDAPAAPERPLFRLPFLNHAIVVLQIVFAVGLLGNDVYRTYQFSSQDAASRHNFRLQAL